MEDNRLNINQITSETNDQEKAYEQLQEQNQQIQKEQLPEEQVCEAADTPLCRERNIQVKEPQVQGEQLPEIQMGEQAQDYLQSGLDNSETYEGESTQNMAEYIIPRLRTSNTDDKNIIKAVTSMILGIVSTVLFCFWYLAIPCAVVSIILGIISMMDKTLKKKGMAIVGIVLSLLSILLMLVVYCGLFGIFKEPLNYADVILT